MSVLHRNSVHQRAYTALVSTHDTSESEDSGASDNGPVLAQHAEQEAFTLDRERFTQARRSCLEPDRSVGKEPVGELSLSSEEECLSLHDSILSQEEKAEMATQPPKPQIRTRHSSRPVNGDGPPVSVLVNDNKPPARERLEIAVLGSARLTENDDWWTQAHQLGALLADEGYVVVTGGYGGLMAAVSRGAHERGGRVIGLPMRHWAGIEPNQWNADLRWSGNYGTRLNHILHCNAAIALPGGVGTLSEMALVWAASQTEVPSLPLVLLGDCWLPIIKSIREHLVVSDVDINLLRFASSPGEAVREIQAGLQDKKRIGPGPRG